MSTTTPHQVILHDNTADVIDAADAYTDALHALHTCDHSMYRRNLESVVLYRERLRREIFLIDDYKYD